MMLSTKSMGLVLNPLNAMMISNTRNNVIIEQRGKISAKRANKAQVEIH